MPIIDSGPDVNYWLGVKYAQLQQHADAASAQAGGAASAAMAQAKLLGTEATANQARLPFVAPAAAAAVRQTNAQTGLLGAQTNESTTLLPYRAQESAAQARLTNTQADFAPALLGSEAQGRSLANIATAANAYGALYANAPRDPNLAENGGALSPVGLATPALSAYLQPSLLARRRAAQAAQAATQTQTPTLGPVNNSLDDVTRVSGL